MVADIENIIPNVLNFVNKTHLIVKIIDETNYNGVVIEVKSGKWKRNKHKHSSAKLMNKLKNDIS